jgi:hypothetical protein
MGAMRTAATFGLLLTLAACEAVPPADAGLDAGPEVGACGVSSYGECREGRFVRCEGAEVLEDDCPDAGGRCGFVGAYAVCTSPAGARCRTLIDHGSHQHLSFAFCEGAGVGCVSGPEEGVCRAGVGACAERDIGRCRGSLYLANCRGDQPIAIDCAAHGGRCDEAAMACVDVPRGGVCDTTRRRCAAGLECRLPFRRALFGRCEPPMP